MMGERLLVAGGTRILSREPSAAVKILADWRPGIFNVEGGGICLNTTSNYVGALILALHRDENRNEYLRAGLPNPREIDTPIELLHDVPLSIFNRKTGEYELTGMVADPVVYKRGSGRKTGIVMAGSLAGLYLRSQTGVRHDEGMCVNRIGNDHPAGEEEFPYPPEFPNPFQLTWDDIKKSFRTRKQRGAFNEIMRRQELRLKEHYQALIKEVGAKLGRAPMESDLFFALCDSLSLPVDQENFHLTRWVEGMKPPKAPELDRYAIAMELAYRNQYV